MLALNQPWLKCRIEWNPFKLAEAPNLGANQTDKKSIIERAAADGLSSDFIFALNFFAQVQVLGRNTTRQLFNWSIVEILFNPHSV